MKKIRAPNIGDMTINEFNIEHYFRNKYLSNEKKTNINQTEVDVAVGNSLLHEHNNFN